MGISQEDQSIIGYIADSGIPYRISATTNHSTNTASGNTSRHVMPGTGGQGLAVDVVPLKRGDIAGLNAIFDVFAKVEPQLYELIYSNAHAPLLVKAGHWVLRTFFGSTVLAGHTTHVHIAVDRGTFLKWNGAPAPAPTPTPSPTQEDPEVWSIRQTALPAWGNERPEWKGRYPFYTIHKDGSIANENVPDGWGLTGINGKGFGEVVGVDHGPQTGEIIIFIKGGPSISLIPGK